MRDCALFSARRRTWGWRRRHGRSTRVPLSGQRRDLSREGPRQPFNPIRGADATTEAYNSRPLRPSGYELAYRMEAKAWYPPNAKAKMAARERVITARFESPAPALISLRPKKAVK